jgi:hypothetical protein
MCAMTRLKTHRDLSLHKRALSTSLRDLPSQKEAGVVWGQIRATDSSRRVPWRPRVLLRTMDGADELVPGAVSPPTFRSVTR